ncbi:polyferredoxin [Magnetospirillum sp. ME-1]|uniref:4Fe-4S binding protein n=1 Tax=Magnetospirillum sp. ME-1 TaxID=1639348 RepID=UPI000A17C442|nr:4Fe-4S binding protein [Magnetospirillum sp. ME-1]ARJ65902.1 polyferredoxin [Magnetospirillum sp. ME-1]
MKAVGDFLHRRQDVVRMVQWGMALVYFVLLLGPVVIPAGGLGRVAEAVFWGVWWPAVILSVMVFGQFWCGVLCPDGTVTECASRHGKGAKPAEWLRWGWWPLLAFAAVTLFSDSVDAHRSAWGTLAAVGGMSLLALATGLWFGKGRRVWCRYLCPAGSVFSLLARASALHFKVDRARWDAAPRPSPKPVDCPLLLDVRRLTSNEKCNMCGRCSGHRGAVELAWRPLGSEIAGLKDDEVRPWDAAGICFVLIGLCFAGFHWTGDIVAILAVALGLGGAVAASLLLAAGRQGWMRLAYALIPLAGFGLFLGAVEHSLALVECPDLLPWLRTVFVTLGLAWSGRLGWGLAQGARARIVFTGLSVGLAALYLLI